ncbi:EI24 domain-containing protein [Amycolatopsis magusensis]|uniref:EI24 domain-containing protein n=1 Tax=Amycolatopsis magusensis TaxID=882444 RepID=UPI0024A9542F|nr:EI24 domain-containing protein [Amycolatopsis magusensis]MDI5981535.1 EI24 domain-containing protein [Amycolatopsis magusensis]
MGKTLRDFGTGAGLLARGFGLVFGNGKLFLLGAIPALLTSLLLFGGILTLALNADDLITWATPFADDWSQTWQTVLRVAAGVSIVVAAVAISLLLFSGLTLILGGPFYEAIAEHVEDHELGGVPGTQQVGWARSAWLGLRDTLLLVLLAILFGIPLFLAGFIPVLGQTVVPVVAALVGAWLLALELTAIPFTRRGLNLKVRRRTLGGKRAMTLGFATPTYLLCLIPLAGIVVLPAAMAGGTLLAHRAREFSTGSASPTAPSSPAR